MSEEGLLSMGPALPSFPKVRIQLSYHVYLGAFTPIAQYFEW